MKLSDKILGLRKQHGMSQEDLGVRLNVSRQAISRWEMGSAQPDATNILQLSKLFGVTSDYLLNDDYESDRDVPAIRQVENLANHKVKRILALCVSGFGLVGNFVIYIISRFVKVMIPHITYHNGEKWYKWSSELTGYNYKYFIQTYNLEFLTVLFWILFTTGLLIAFVSKEQIKETISKIKIKRLKKASNNGSDKIEN